MPVGRPFHLRSQTYGLTPVPNVLWDPPVPPSPLPVTRRGVRGLIICSDPGLPARDGCHASVALDPIDAAREREGEKSGGEGGGEENRPWLQAVGPPRQVDECPGLHDLCHPKPVESGYNDLQSPG